MRITLKLWDKANKAKTYTSNKTRRIFSLLKAEDFSKALIKVFYGKAKTNNRIIEPIVNSGIYFSKVDAHHAMTAFTEKSLIEETEKWIKESTSSSYSHNALQTSSLGSRE